VEQYEDEIAQTLALSLLSLDDLNAKSTVGGTVSKLEKAKNLMAEKKQFQSSFPH